MSRTVKMYLAFMLLKMHVQWKQQYISKLVCVPVIKLAQLVAVTKCILDKLTDDPSTEQKALQIWDTNCQRRYLWRCHAGASHAGLGGLFSRLSGRREFGQGHKVSCFGEAVYKGEYDKVSIGGPRPVMKSRAIWDQGRLGTGRRQRKPAGAEWEDLFWAQVEQAATNSLVSASIVGHQKRHWRTDRVRIAPGWQNRREECPHWRTWKQAVWGTKSLLGGLSLGSGSEPGPHGQLPWLAT